jgi:DNA-binding transcriptional regulator YiaG
MKRKEIKRARLAQGLSQEQLAAKLEMHPQTISNWERGRQRPQGATLVLLRMVLRGEI